MNTEFCQVTKIMFTLKVYSHDIASAFPCCSFRMRAKQIHLV